MEPTKEQQFAQLVRRHKSTIYSICYMFSSDKDEVADLFQDILIRLWDGYEKFRGESKETTWIYRVSMNTCISADRKRKSRGERVPLSMDIDLYTDQDDDTQQVQALYKPYSPVGTGGQSHRNAMVGKPQLRRDRADSRHQCQKCVCQIGAHKRTIEEKLNAFNHYNYGRTTRNAGSNGSAQTETK